MGLAEWLSEMARKNAHDRQQERLRMERQQRRLEDERRRQQQEDDDDGAA